VQKFFGAARASLGSLSEASTVFDSQLLKQIIEELSTKLSNVSTIPGFKNSNDILTAVDGSVIEALGKMAWALWRTDRNGIKVHLVGKYVSVPVDVLVKYYKNAGRMVLRGLVFWGGYGRGGMVSGFVLGRGNWLGGLVVLRGVVGEVVDWVV
jgi:hypothetical protein